MVRSRSAGTWRGFAISKLSCIRGTELSWTAVVRFNLRDGKIIWDVGKARMTF